MIINNVTKVQVTNTILTNNSANVVTADCNNVHWVNNDASFAFSQFPNLTSVANIGNTVENVGGMFYGSESLVNAPTIPASVTNTIGVGGTVTYYAWSLQEPIHIYKSFIYRVYTLIEDLSEYASTWQEVPCYIYNETTELFEEFDYLYVNYQTDFDAFQVEFLNNIRTTTITRQGAYDEEAAGSTAVGLFENCSGLVTGPAFGGANTTLDRCFANCTSLTTVPSLPANTTTMVNTFDNCLSLTNVANIPDTVTDLSYTFVNCYALTDAPIIPNSVTTMYRTFGDCRSLINVNTLSSNVSNMALAFDTCTNLTHVAEIPNSVTNMNSTFAYCLTLQTVPNIPSSVTDLGHTFQNCAQISNLPTVPNTVTSLNSTFYACTNVTNLANYTIPNSVTDLRFTFAVCYNLVTAPVIPESVITMQNTFRSCHALTTAPEIPNSVTTLADTFCFCDQLDFPAGSSWENKAVTNMYETFYGCNSLTNVPALPNNVTNMYLTFGNCISLVTAPIIPNTVNDMRSTFRNCTNLAGDVVIYSELINNTYNCFNGTELTKNVYIPLQNNEVNTATYNAFMTAGYSTSSRVNGAQLFDISEYVPPTPEPKQKTIDTDGFTYTVDENDVVVLTGLDMADKSTVTLPNID